MSSISRRHTHERASWMSWRTTIDVVFGDVNTRKGGRFVGREVLGEPVFSGVG